MRIIKDPDTRRQEILDGAIKVFSQKGYDKTTISDIAKELGISQGLCYRYFDSKETVYDATIEQYADLIVESKLKNKRDDINVHEFIDSFTSSEENFTELEKVNPVLYELFHSENNRRMHNELFIRVLKKMIPHTTILLENFNKRGEIKLTDCQTTANFMLFGIFGMFEDEKIESAERMKKIRIMIYELLGIK